MPNGDSATLHLWGLSGVLLITYAGHLAKAVIAFIAFSGHFILQGMSRPYIRDYSLLGGIM